MEVILDSHRVQSTYVLIPGVNTISPKEWNDPHTGQPWLSSVSSGPTPNISIYAFDHGVRATNFSWNTLVKQGEALLERLADLEGESRTPIIVVAHSVGGFVVKEAIRLANEQTSRYKQLLKSLGGVLFLGVPHSTKVDDPRWKHIAYATLRQGSTFKTKDLPDPKDRLLLADLCSRFEEAAVSIPVISMYETLATKIKVSMISSIKENITSEAFVETHSRNEKLLSVESDHKDLCLLDARSPYFRQLRSYLDEAIEDARLLVAQGTPDYDIPAALDAMTMRDTDSETGDPNERSKGSGESSDPFATTGSPAAKVESIPLVSDFGTALKDPHLPCHIVPIGRNTEFFSRGDILKRLSEEFFPLASETSSVDTPERLKVFALCGPGGMGKTQIAAEFVHTHQSRFDAIFWIYADVNAKIVDAFSTIAIQLGLVQQESSDARDPVVVRELVKGFLANPLKSYESLEKATWLIVFDNADALDVIGDYWPLDGPGSVLLTSRDPLGPTWITNIAVDPFTPEEASNFLIQLTGRNDEQKTGLDVARRLGGIPLAMSQMAGIIIRRDLSFSEFLLAYEEKESQEEFFQLNMDKPLRRSSNYGHTLASVWALESLKHGRALLDVLSFLDPDGIPEKILTSLTQSKSTHKSVSLLHDYPRSAAEYQRARTELLQSSLISRDRTTQKVRVHRLVQDVAKAKMSAPRARFAFATCLRLVSHVWPFETFGWRHEVARWASCEELFPHVLKLFEASNHTTGSVQDDPISAHFLAVLLTDAGWYYHECGNSLGAMPLFERAQAICDSLHHALDTEEQLGEPPLSKEKIDLLSAEIHHNIGCVATETNKPAVALHHFTMFNKIVADQVDISAPDNTTNKKHAIALNELGIAHMMNKGWKKAEQCFVESVRIMETVDISATELKSLPTVNLGLAYWSMGGRLDEADAVLMAGLADRETKYGPDDRDSFVTGRFLHAIGNVKADLAQLNADESLLDEARSYHQRALAHYKATIGKNHHRTADTCVKVADHCIRLGFLKDAMKLLDQALKAYGGREIYEPERARATFKRSSVWRLLGQDDEAQKDLEASYKLLQHVTDLKGKGARDLCDADFDEVIVFWSK